MSGNVGTQSLAVTIRFLTDDQLDAKAIFKLIGKEARIGFSENRTVNVIKPQHIVAKEEQLTK